MDDDGLGVRVWYDCRLTLVADPLGDFTLSGQDFRAVGKELKRTGYPLLACLEGGYDVENIGGAAADFTEGLLGLA